MSDVASQKNPDLRREGFKIIEILCWLRSHLRRFENILNFSSSNFSSMNFSLFFVLCFLLRSFIPSVVSQPYAGKGEKHSERKLFFTFRHYSDLSDHFTKCLRSTLFYFMVWKTPGFVSSFKSSVSMFDFRSNRSFACFICYVKRFFRSWKNCSW